MTAGLIPVILFAAVLHATWNAFGKLIPDRLASAALMGMTYFVIGAIAVPFLPVPAQASWGYLLGSSVLQSGYLLLLMSSYRVGDFGQVYPLARGMSPLVVTAFSLTVLGEHLSGLQLAGIALVCGGLIGLVFVQGIPRRGKGHGLAVLTGLTIAAYTLLDGVGVRHSGAPVSYAMWLFLLQGPVIPLLGFVRRGSRFLPSLAPHWRLGLAGGVLSLVSYGIVVWAQNRSPLAAVSTLRETSVVFAAFIGRAVFGEPLGRARILAACVVAAGIVAIASP